MRQMPSPMPKALKRDVTPEVTTSPALSLFARPGDGSIRARRVAILVADGCDGEPLTALAERLTAEGAVPRFVGATLGTVKTATGERWTSTQPRGGPVGALRRGGRADDGDAVRSLRRDGRALEFIKDQYRHCKPLLVLGDGVPARGGGIPATLPSAIPIRA